MIEPITLIVTALVAVYGAVFATITFVQQRRQRQESLRVRLSNGIVDMGTGQASPLMLFVEIANICDHPTELQPPHIRLPDRKILMPMQPVILGESRSRFPYVLDPRRHITVGYIVDELKESLVEHGYARSAKLRVYVNDYSGRRVDANKPWRLA
jgi:hypothetical protein